MDEAGVGLLPLPPRRRPTIKDVAAAAGVSPSAASRALRGEGYVGEDARQRVLAAASELGYVPHKTARSLKDRVSRCVGVVCRDVQDPVTSGVVAGVCAAARGRGLMTVLVDAGGNDGDADGDLRELVALGVTGVVLVPGTTERARFLQRYAVPVVEVGEPVAPGLVDGVVASPQGGLSGDDGVALGRAAVDVLVTRLTAPDAPTASVEVPRRAVPAAGS